MAEAGGTEREVITFWSGSEEFCIDLMSVRAIQVWRPAVHLLHAPNFVRGLLKLNGSILPIVDFAARLGMTATNPTNHHVIIIVEIGHQVAGLLVEGGMSVFLTINQDMIKLAPSAASKIAEEFVKGVVQADGRMINWISLNSIVPENINLFAACAVQRQLTTNCIGIESEPKFDAD